MTMEEYEQKLEQLKLAHRTAVRNLQKDYAIANNPYKPGDIVRDSTSILKIEGIHSIYISLSGPPCLMYKGTELTKQLKPTKKQQQTTIVQSMIIEKL